MKRLVLLSELCEKENIPLQRRVKELIGKEAAKLGYIPSRSDRDRKYFNAAKNLLNKFGFTDYLFFDLDEEYDPSLRQELLACDAIFMTGGNTFYFLNSLRRRDMIDDLRAFVERGGMLVGFSAGSILMSESIAIAHFIDRNELLLHDLSALNLVDFDFMPHWEELKGLEDRLVEYAVKNARDIYTCKDGDGIVVVGDKLEFFGDINIIR